MVELGTVGKQELNRFDIKQEVFFADIKWKSIQTIVAKKEILLRPCLTNCRYTGDLAMIVPTSLPYNDIEAAIKKIKLNKLRSVELFDVFESEKLGSGKNPWLSVLPFWTMKKRLPIKK